MSMFFGDAEENDNAHVEYPEGTLGHIMKQWSENAKKQTNAEAEGVNTEEFDKGAFTDLLANLNIKDGVVVPIESNVVDFLFVKTTVNHYSEELSTITINDKTFVTFFPPKETRIVAVNMIITALESLFGSMQNFMRNDLDAFIDGYYKDEKASHKPENPNA